MLKILLLIFEINYSFIFGYVIEDDLKIYKTPEENKIYFAEYEVDILISKYFFVNNILQINMYEIEFLGNYDPYQIQFDISTGVRLHFIEIGFHHYCIHPIVTNYITKGFYPKIRYEGMREELYIKFSNKKE